MWRDATSLGFAEYLFILLVLLEYDNGVSGFWTFDGDRCHLNRGQLKTISITMLWPACDFFFFGILYMRFGGQEHVTRETPVLFGTCMMTSRDMFSWWRVLTWRVRGSVPWVTIPPPMVCHQELVVLMDIVVTVGWAGVSGRGCHQFNSISAETEWIPLEYTICRGIIKLWRVKKQKGLTMVEPELETSFLDGCCGPLLGSQEGHCAISCWELPQ